MTKRTLLHRTKRSSYAVWAFVLIVATAIPMLKAEHAAAYGLLGSRYIKMSNSSAGNLTAGQNVSYEVGFTMTTADATIGSLVIQFCANSPIIPAEAASPCTNPSTFGFDTNFATLAFGSGVSGITDFTIDTTNSTSNKLVLTRPAAALVGTPSVVIPLGNGTNNGITNPVDVVDNAAPNGSGNQVGTYYARMMLYSSTDGSGTPIDAGGVALSTTVSLDITSKVQERLKFCVYRDISCAAATAGGAQPNNTFNLGNNNGVLDSVGPFVDNNTRYDVATNASGGVNVRMKGDTLKTGGFSIDAIGLTPQTAHVGGTEQFGFCTWAVTAGATTIQPQTPYDSGGCSTTSQTSGTTSSGGTSAAVTFAFDTNTTDGTMSTYGDIFAFKPAGPEATGRIAFVGNVADTTEAGIYTTTLNLIATGTY